MGEKPSAGRGQYSRTPSGDRRRTGQRWGHRVRWGVRFRSPAFPGGSDCKESACSVRDPGSIPGSGRSPGEGNGYSLQYSCLENSGDRGGWWATVRGVVKSQAGLSDQQPFRITEASYLWPDGVRCITGVDTSGWKGEVLGGLARTTWCLAGYRGWDRGKVESEVLAVTCAANCNGCAMNRAVNFLWKSLPRITLHFTRPWEICLFCCTGV